MDGISCTNIIILCLVTTLSISESSIILELFEPAFSQAVALSVGMNETRSINLVPGHTYHVSCKDTSNQNRFESQDLNVWTHNGSRVLKLYSGTFPSSGEAAVFSSTDVRVTDNEWTLVLQVFGVVQAGVYACHGLDDGEVLSIDVGVTSLSVITGNSERFLTLGPLPDNIVITLSVFISPITNSSITWFFNGDNSFPSEVTLVRSYLVLRDSITESAQGRYKCLVENGGLSASVVITVYVNVSPDLVFDPSSLRTSEEVAFNGSRLSVSCVDDTGFPLSDISWYRNGTRLQTDGDRVTVAVFKNSSISRAELVIDPVLTSDHDTYECGSQNIVGKSQRSFTLAHIIVLSPLVDHMTWLEGETISLRVIFHGYDINSTLPPLLDYRWLKDGVDIVTSLRTTIREHHVSTYPTVELEITEATRDDVGKYSFHVSTTLSMRRVTFDLVTIINRVIIQLRLLEIGSCQDWVNTNGPSKAEIVMSTIISNINLLCPNCSLTMNHISLPLFLCFPDSPRAVTFRVHLYGTSNIPSFDLINHLEEWIRTAGTISIGVVLTNLDPSCQVVISSVKDPECVTGGDIGGAPQNQGVPLMVVIGISVGIGLLLFIMVVVTIVSTFSLVVIKNRRVVAMETNSKDKNKKPSPRGYLNPVNPSLTVVSNHQHDEEEPQYEDIDFGENNDVIQGRNHVIREEDHVIQEGDHVIQGVTCPYEVMNSVQIMPTNKIKPKYNDYVAEYDYAAV